MLSNPTPKPYTLYGRSNSGSFVVEVALEEIGLPFDYVEVSQEAEDVAKFSLINPTGKVPALRLPDGTVLFESAAILMHLALAHPAARLSPEPQSSEYSRFLQWMVYLAVNPYQSVIRIYYSSRFSPRGETDAASIREQGTIDLVNQLRFVNDVLDPYLLGATYSIADTYLYMLATWYPGDKEALYGDLGRLGAHAKLIASRPAIAKVERLRTTS